MTLRQRAEALFMLVIETDRIEPHDERDIHVIEAAITAAVEAEREACVSLLKQHGYRSGADLIVSVRCVSR